MSILVYGSLHIGYELITIQKVKLKQWQELEKINKKKMEQLTQVFNIVFLKLKSIFMLDPAAHVTLCFRAMNVFIL
jgi:hypothetical protein